MHQLKEQINLAIYGIIRTTVNNQATTTPLQ